MKKIGFIIGALILLIAVAAYAAETMGLAGFQQMAIENANRCNPDGTPEEKGMKFLNVALQYNLITREVYDWAIKNRFYPVIGFELDRVESVCTFGCFEAEMRLLYTNPEIDAEDWIKAKDLSKGFKIWSVSSDSTLSEIQLEESKIKTITSGPESPQLYVFTLSNGNVLKLTEHHGVLVSDGRMIEAKDVNVNHKLVSYENGELVDIISITREYTDEDVYNFEVERNDNINHVIVSEGVLVGDLAWQNRLANELNEILIRNQ